MEPSLTYKCKLDPPAVLHVCSFTLNYNSTVMSHDELSSIPRGFQASRKCSSRDQNTDAVSGHNDVNLS